MKQRFTKLLAAFALLVFMMPSLVAWGQTTVTVNASKVTSASFTWSTTSNSVEYTWSGTVDGGALNQNVTNEYAQIGTKNSPSTSITLTSSSFSGTISSVVLDCASYNGLGTVSATVGGNAFGTQSQSIPSWSNNAGGEVTFTGSNSGEIVITMTNGSGGRAMYIKSVAVTYTTGGGQTYTITALSNNTDYGTVSLTGSVITGTPATGCRYADPAYTVDPANSATVAQEGNDFTVTPSANTTVTINFEPIPTHTATFSVNGATTTQSFAEGAAIVFPTNPTNINGMSFIGWVTDAIVGTTNTAPSIVNTATATMGNSDVTFFACFAEAGSSSSPSLTKMTSTDTFAANDKVVIVASDNIAMYQATINSSYVNKYTFDNSVSTVAADDKNWLTVSAGSTNNTWKIGDATNGYVYNGSSNNLEINANNSTDFTLAWNSTQEKFTLVGNSRWLSYRSDLDNKYFRMGGGTSGNPSGVAYFDIYKYDAGSTSYSNYCTTVPEVAVAKPEIDVAENPFMFSTTVTITCATDGAIIYYTTDGSNPTTSSSVYSESFPINSTTTIKAMAVKGSDESTIAEVYAVKELATPTVEISSLNIDVDGTATVTTNGPAITLSTSNASIASVSGTTVTGVAAGTATITATWSANNDYSAGNKYFTVVVTDPNAGTINFGSAAGHTKINTTNVTGTDSKGNTWTITTVFSGETSFTQSSNYSQVGSADKPATSITFTTTLPLLVNVTSFSAKFGGYNGTAGDVTLKVGETTVGTGSLNGSNDVTVSNTSTEKGTVLTVTVTGIAKGVKCYSISYSYKLIPFISINGHGGNAGNWYLIASPLAEDTDPEDIDGLVATDGYYDLYRFNQNPTVTNENDYLEWENYKIHTNDFVLENGKGYLYASQESTTIYFDGACNNDDTKTVSLDYSTNNPDVNMCGWNLVGNPFTTVAYANHSYFVMDGNGTSIVAEPVSSTTAINPFTGVFVQATETGQSVTFSKTATGTTNNKGVVNLALSQQVNRGSAMVDKAVVSFNEGDQLGKFVFMESNAKLYIPKNGKDYAIAVAEAQGEMPVNFKAQENGTYTLNIDTENVEMNYLHLIDNMTGMDVDLLQTPNYTFDATTNDYASRFRLVFSANNVDGPSTGSETFAFYSNGNWVVNNEGEATLQVIDVNGRIVSNETINGTVATSINATPGVYMLRLVNGNEVKTQKIVVK